jgi:hypothetical protein
MKIRNEMQLNYHENQDANARKQDDLPTYLGPEAHGDQMLWMSGEIVQPVQPVDHLIKVSPLCLIM